MDSCTDTTTNSPELKLSTSLVETLEVKGGSGPIVMTLRSLPAVNGGYIKITENDEAILFHRERNWYRWSDLNDSSFSSRTKRITVEFKPTGNRHREFTSSYLEWTFAGGYDMDPDQFCDCCRATPSSQIKNKLEGKTS